MGGARQPRLGRDVMAVGCASKGTKMIQKCTKIIKNDQIDVLFQDSSAQFGLLDISTIPKLEAPRMTLGSTFTPDNF